MDRQINPVLQAISNWPDAAADMGLAIRAHWQQTAQALDLPPLDESLKWGEPAWRPRKGGTTLRMNWKGDAEGLGIYMDCKTDLCARMQSDFPDAFRYAPPRALFLQPGAELPQDALTHLAKIAFRYKRVLPAK